jgi:hypothetical protein
MHTNIKAGEKRREVVKKINVFRNRVLLPISKVDGATVLRGFNKLPKRIIAG